MCADIVKFMVTQELMIGTDMKQSVLRDLLQLDLKKRNLHHQVTRSPVDFMQSCVCVFCLGGIFFCNK